jgi:uncharacterized delta-60 repeat protein/CSLREA domain-containing protein
MIFRWLEQRRRSGRTRPSPDADAVPTLVPIPVRSAPGTRTRARARARAEEVEPRILLAADAVAGLLPDPTPASSAEVPAPIVRSLAAEGDAVARVDAETVTEVVFVDAAVNDAQGLVDAVVAQRPDASLRIVLLDPGRDAFVQIGETLAQMQDVSTVHVVAHGEPGALLLSGARVDAAAVDAARDVLARWRDALTADADLLLYGCDVAATPEGVDLLARLARHTGADVAASEDATGSSALGGDWQLESATGSVEARALFADGAPLAWEGVLDIAAASGEIVVNTVTAGDQLAVYSQRSVAVAADGSSVVVWQDDSGQDGAGAGVFAQRFDAAGTAAGAQFRVNGTTSGDQTAPEVAIAASGEFIVTWTDWNGDAAVYAKRYAADGTALSISFVVHTYTADNQSLSSVAMDASGNSVIVWQSQGEDGSGLGIYARRYDAAGNAAGAAFAVNTTTASDQENAKVAMDELGGFVVVWQSTLQDGDGASIVARRYDASGNALTGELLVNQTFANNQVLPDVAIDADGFVVAWMSATQDGDSYGIYARRYDADGNALAAEFRVNDTTVSSQDNPQLVRTAGGGFVVAWESFGQDGDQMGVFLRQYGANGAALTGETAVNTTTAGWQSQPSIAVSDAGTLHLVWTSNQGGSQDVWMRRFTLTEPGIVIGALTPDSAEDGSTGSFNVTLATAPASDVTVTITVSDPTEAQASVVTLVFTAADWSTPQPVTLTGRADGLVDGPTAYTVTLSAASADGGYQGLSTTVAAVNADIDTRNSITVTTVADTVDGDTSSLAALLDDRGADGEVSLREALLAANATVNAVGGADRIVFDIAGGGPHVIALGSALPTITDAVVIDGSSEPDFAVNGNRPVVVLDGNGLTGQGLSLSDTADGSTIHGLVIRDFGGSGIVTERGSDGHLITGNYLGGLDTLGQLAPGEANTFAGIWMAGAGSTVGGVTPDLRNVISNNLAGVVIGGAAAVGNVVIGNAIGVAADGSTAAGNLDFGVVTFLGATGSRLGGTSAGEGNLVAYSGVSGVVVDGSPALAVSMSILGNVFVGNSALGIDLMSDGISDGVTANDADDLDTGGNGQQNFPVLLSAVTTGTTVAIRGELASTANTSFRVEFYNNPLGTEDPSGHGEGRVFLFATDVTTDGTGRVDFDLAPVAASVAVGDRVTATATVSLGGGAYGGTSEFSMNLPASAANSTPVVTTTISPTSFTEGDAATPVDAGLLVTDIGGGTIVGATVRVSVGYVAGEDVLGFADQSGIAGAWNAGTGVLTLTGSASLADYQAALRSVTYANASQNPNIATRTVEFVVDDGSVDSAGATRQIQVAAVGDAPGGIALLHPAGVNLIVNGSFEDNTATPGTITAFASLPGWIEVAGDSFEVWAAIDGTTQGGPADASDGTSRLEIDGFGGVNGIAQTVNTVANQAYVLSFDLASRGTISESRLEVYWRGALVATVEQTAAEWQTHRFVLTGSGGADELRLMETAARNDTVGELLDDVRLVAAATPAIAVAENSANGTVVAIAAASDPDAATPVANTYGLVDDAGGRFAIGAGTGIVTVADGSLLDRESAASHDITIRVTDAGGLSRDEVFTIGVTNVYEAPAVTTTPGSRSYNENDGAAAIDTGLTLRVDDGATVAGATLRISVAYAAGEDVLGFVDQAGISGTWDGGTGTLTLSGTASAAAYQTALRSVTYTNGSEDPSILLRTVEFTVDDGVTQSTATREVQVVSINDAPVTATVGGTGAEDAASIAVTLSGTDVDGAVDRLRLVDLPTDGTLYVDAGLTTVAAISTDYAASGQALTLYFVPDADWNGTATFRYVAVDGGGAADATAATATLAATAVNDAPVLVGGGALSFTPVSEDAVGNAGQSVASLIASLGGDPITDVDAGALEGIAITSATWSDDNGWFEYSLDAGGNWSRIISPGVSTALLLRADDLIRFVPQGYGAETASITFRAWDRSSGVPGGTADTTVNGGTTAFGTTTRSAAITTDSVNDAPDFGAPQPGASRIDLTGTAGSDRIEDAVLLADGSLLTVGHGWTVSRFAADGSVVGVYAGGDIASGVASGIVRQPDGRFVVVGTVFNGTDFDIGIRRHNADGSIDTGFGVAGLVTVDLGGSNSARGVAIQTDGAILVAGTGGGNLRVIRLDGADGTLDAGFGSGGIATVDLGSTEHAADIALDSSGRILIAGSHGGTGAAFLARLTSTGALDAGFGSGGFVTTLLGGTDASASALLVQADGRIVIAGESHDGGQPDAQTAFGIARFTADGSFDTSFGGTGVVRTDFEGPGWSGGARSIAQQADGRLVVVGEIDLGKGQTDWAIVRYDTDGSLDAGFDGDGRLTPVTGRWWNDANAVAVAADGTIVVAGGASYTGNPDALVMRFETDGTLRTALQSGRLNGTPSVVEGGAAVVMDADVRLFDRELTDANAFAGATLTLLRDGGANADDVFGATGLLGPLVEGGALVHDGVTIGTVTTNSGGTLVLSFGAGATGTRVNGVLNALSYAHAGDTPPTAVQIDWTFDDGNAGAQGSGGALATTGSVTVSIVSTNDAPSDIDLASPVATNLLVNGSFETNGAPTGAWTALASLPGWTPVGESVIEVWNAYDDGGPGAASDGQSLVELDHLGGTVSGIAQSVVTTAGQVYLLSFDFASRTAVGTSDIEVYWRGERVATASQPGAGWRTYGVLVTGSGGADELRLMESAASDDGIGSLVDDVRLVAVQTPAIEIAENSANGSVVARAGAADPEGAALEGLGYTLVDDAGGRFAIDAQSGVLTVADGTRLDREASTAHLVTVRVIDGTGLSRDEVFSIAVADVPEVPVLTTTSGSATFTENAVSVAVDAALTLTDPDSATLVGATVRIAVAYESGEDLLAFTDQSGIVGSWNAGTGTLTLSGVASVADYQAALRSVTYSNTEVLPSTTPRSIEFVASDAQGSSIAVSRTLAVIATNDAPTAAHYTTPPLDENTPTGSVVAAAPVVDDPNPGDVHTFTLRDDAGGAFAIDAVSGALSVADASRLDFETAPSLTVVVRVEDSGGLFFDETVSITLNDVNEAPVNTLPSDQYTAVDTALVFGAGAGRPIAVADVDGDVLRVTLSVSDGTLTLSGTTGLTLVAGGNGSASMSFTGSQAAFDTALEGLRFDPAAGWRGLVELTVVTEDLAGGGGALVDTDRLRIHVGALVVTTTADLVNGDTASLAGLAADDGGDGISLREAILAANASANGLGGPDRIHFQIPDALVGGGHLIALASALPTLTDAVVIDGGTDADWAANGNRPVIVIDGGGLGTDGLVFAAGADGSTVRGLVIRDFDGSGIRIDAGSDGHLIEGNFIGSLGVDGTDAGAGEANTGWGVLVRGAGTTVGGSTVAAANVIAGNGSGGLLLSGMDADGNRVSGNRIGSAADGVTVLGNGGSGGPGVSIAAAAAGNLVGSAVAGGGNLIVGHSGAGIALAADAGSGNALLGNLIRANAGLGIDLGDDGLDPIDAGDADAGPNDRQNAALIASTSSGGVATTVTGTLDAAPLTTYRIEFFSLDAADAHAAGAGGARVLLGATSVTSDGSGQVAFAALLPAVAVGDRITATVTVDLGGGLYGSTSEFATNRTVTLPPPVIDLDADDSAGVTGGGYRTSFTEGGAPAALADLDAMLTDPDSAQLASMRFTLAARPDGVAELLTADTSGTSIAASWDAGAGTLTLSGLASVADYRQVLGSVAYTNASQDPDTSQRTIAVRVTDDTGLSSDVVVQVLVSSVADAPVITSDGGGATAGLMVAENATAVTLPAATDTDTAPVGLGWSITGGADAARFAVDPVTGALSFAVAPDTESPVDVDGDNVYEVHLTVSDGMLTDTQVLSVTVADLDEFDLGAVGDTDAAADVVSESATNGALVGVTARAVDADATATVTYTLDDDAGGRFAIDATTGVVTVADASLLDAETSASHAIVVRASSSDGSTGIAGFTIAVSDTNDSPVGPATDVNAAADSVIENAANGTSVGLTIRAVDTDATATVAYSLDDDAGGRFAIDAATGVVTVANGSLLDAETATSHAITVRAMSSDGSVVTVSRTIAVGDLDESDVAAVGDTNPAADAVAENAANGTTVGVTVRAIDADATATVAYSLDDDAGGRFAIDAASGVVRVANGSLLDAETATSHTITVRAVSSDASFVTSVHTISVGDLDEFDVGVPGDTDSASDTVAENSANGAPVGLTVRAVDADATASVAYSLTDDAGGRFAIDAVTGVVTVADGTLIDAEASASHTIAVRATSSDGSMSTTGFTIAVGDTNEAAIGALVDVNGAADAVAENAANGTAVGVTARAVDPDATSTVAYALDDDAGGRFAIDAVTGVVTVANGSLLDAETATSHAITVRASSSDGSFVTVARTIAVGDLDESDVGPAADTDAAADSVAENSANGALVGLTARAVDADVTATIAYSLDDDAGGRFSIDAASGVVRVADGSLLDAETALQHRITVRASSSDGSFSTTSFDIGIGDVPDSGMAPPVDTDTLPDAVLENAANGTAVGLIALGVDVDATAVVGYLLNDDAGGRFAIDAVSGVVSVADGSLLDADTNASHTVVVRALSSDGSTSVASFTIQVGDVDEFDIGAIGDAAVAPDSAGEGAATGASTGLTARAVDGDATATVTYTLDDDAGGRFAIDTASGAVTVADGSLLDAEIAASHAIVVRASSSDGSTVIAGFTIAVADANETAIGPATDVNGAPDAVAENAANGTTVGVTARATDADATATISYSLDDNAGGRFAIDAVSGVVRVADGSLLDAEVASSHAIVIRAASDDGSSSVYGVTVSIDDVDEFDVAASTDPNGAPNSVVENAAAGTVVGLTARAIDADATASVSYQLVDDAGGRFAIDASTGVVTVAEGTLLDAELATSHAISVRASSSDGSVSTTGFVITVADVGEFALTPPVDINAAVDAVDENAANGTAVGVVVQAFDADAGTTVTYALDDDAGGRFAIDSATGMVTVADGTLIDAELAASHAIVVRATSSDGGTGVVGLTIAIRDLDEFDVGAVLDVDAASNSVAENAAGGTAVGVTAAASDADLTAAVTYSLDDDAGGRFAIDATTGVVTVADGSLLDAELAASHAIVARATSSDGSSRMAGFTVSIVDLNEGGLGPITDLNPTADSVPENAADGSTVGVTARAIDADATATIAYALDDDAGGRFAIDAASGVVRVADGSLLDADTVAIHAVVVRATSSDGSFRTAGFTISLLPLNDLAPTITSDGGGATALRTVSENLTAVTTVAAVDLDLPSSPLTYSISGGADAARFSIDAVSGALVFRAAPDFETPADADGDNVYEVTVAVTDGLLADSQMLSVTVAGVAEAPVVGVPGLQSVDEDTLLSIAGLSATDIDGDLATVSLSVTQGMLSVDLAGGAVLSAMSPGMSSLTLSGSQAQLAAALATVGYQGLADTFGTDVLTVTATDASGLQQVRTVSIAVAPVNDPAVLLRNLGLSAPELGTIVVGAAQLDVADVDDAATGILIRLESAPTAGRLLRDGAMLAAGDTFTQDDVDTGRITYRHLAVGVLDDTLVLNATDGDGAWTGAFTVAVRIDLINDAPQLVAPVRVSTPEDTPFRFSDATGTRLFAIDDADASAQVEVRVSVDAGATLTLSETTGLVFLQGDGRADAGIVFRATLFAANRALDGLLFAPPPNGNATHELSLSIDDLGSTGSGGPLAATARTVVSVVPVNDLPTISVPAVQAMLEDTVLSFGPAGGNRIVIGDVDAAGTVRLSLSVDAGALELGPAPGLRFLVGGTVPASVVAVEGSVAALQLALDGLRYLPPADFGGVVGFDLMLDDRVGGVVQVRVPIVVSPVADATDARVPGAQSVRNDGTLSFGTAGGNPIVLFDVDDRGASVYVRLSVPSGRLTISAPTGLEASSSGDGEAGGTVLTLLGPMNTINAALDTLRYTPVANGFGTTVLAISIESTDLDGERTLRALRSVSIVVSAVGGIPEFVAPTSGPIGADGPLSGANGRPADSVEPVARAAPAETGGAATGPSGLRTRVLATSLVAEPLVAAVAPPEALVLAPPAARSPALSAEGASQDGMRQGTGGAPTAAAAERTVQLAWLAVSADGVTFGMPAQTGVTDTEAGVLDAFLDPGTAVRQGDPVDSEIVFDMSFANSARAAGLAFTAGAVWWTIYGGTTLWILVAAGPLARNFDPLQVLWQADEDDAPEGSRDRADALFEDDDGDDGQLAAQPRRAATNAMVMPA